MVSMKIVHHLFATRGFQVDVLCNEPPDSHILKQTFGSDAGQISVISARNSETSKESTNLRFLTYAPKVNLRTTLLRIAQLHRFAKKIASNYTICISTYNEQDFGQPALQYVHHPLFADREILCKYQIIPDGHVLSSKKFPAYIYKKLIDVVANGTQKNRQHNVSLTNSRFISDVLEECGFREKHVLYPGFFDTLPQNPSDKEKIVFSLGRITPDKHILRLLRIYESLSSVNPDFKFIIAGSTPDPNYLREVDKAIKHSDAKITLLTNLNRTAVNDLMQRSMFYVNPKPFEHFGITTIEVLSYGCIPLLDNSGGSVEIVEGEEKLLFRTASDISAIFEWHLKNPEPSQSIIKKLQSGLGRFSSEQFFQKLDAQIEAMIK